MITLIYVFRTALRNIDSRKSGKCGVFSLSSTEATEKNQNEEPMNARACAFSLIFLASTAVPDAGFATGTGDSSAPLVISAGQEGRGYWGVASRLQSVGEEKGLTVEIMQSGGSLENLQRLADPQSPVALALTQSDALNQFLGTNPELAPSVEILEYIGQECVFIIADNDSGIRSDADLTRTNGQRIAISNVDSGAAVTFAYMSLLEPELKNTGVVYMDPLQAMQNFDNAKVDAVMLVQRPKVRTPEILLALERPSDFRFVEVNNAKFRGKLPDGEKVYSVLDIPLLRAEGEVTMSVNSICTKGLLVASANKLSADQRRQLNQSIDYDWMRVYATEF